MVSLTKITPISPGCYGVGCCQRAECARYHAVEGTVLHLVIASCFEGDEFPRFSPMEVVEAAISPTEKDHA